jgi:hypothetical protein
MSNKIAGVVTKLVSALQTLQDADERQRAVQAALTVFGDASTTPSKASDPKLDCGVEGGAPGGMHANGTLWMKRNGLSAADIEEVFHFDDEGVTLIKSVGKAKHQQAINAYLLTGVAALLHTGKADFTDETARANCVNLGCYDRTNHAKAIGSFENKITGSKKAGWKLTSPGLAAAAALLKTRETKDVK